MLRKLGKFANISLNRQIPALFPSIPSLGPGLITRMFHSSRITLGIEEFLEPKKPNEFVATGRAWTAADLRRKSFDDLHKLWFVLYKERNVLLSEKQTIRRAQRPYTRMEENRYISVKRSMAAIKFVLAEREKVMKMIAEKEGKPESA